MSGLLESLRVIIENVILNLGYGGIALLMFVENLFPPIPSELVVPFAGFLVSDGRLNFALVLAASALGTLLGALVLYELGRRLPETRLRAFLRGPGRYLGLSESGYDRALAHFHRHERSVVLWARLLPGIRSLISIPAGVAHMPLGSFLLFTALGTIAWNLLLLSADVLLGENWPRILDWLDRYEVVVYALLVLLAVWLLARALLERRPRRLE